MHSISILNPKLNWAPAYRQCGRSFRKELFNYIVDVLEFEHVINKYRHLYDTVEGRTGQFQKVADILENLTGFDNERALLMLPSFRIGRKPSPTGTRTRRLGYRVNGAVHEFFETLSLSFFGSMTCRVSAMLIFLFPAAATTSSCTLKPLSITTCQTIRAGGLSGRYCR